jgi:hypothetical protein
VLSFYDLDAASTYTPLSPLIEFMKKKRDVDRTNKPYNDLSATPT